MLVIFWGVHRLDGRDCSSGEDAKDIDEMQVNPWQVGGGGD